MVLSTYSHIFKAYNDMELILSQKPHFKHFLSILSMRYTTDIDDYVHFIVTCRY